MALWTDLALRKHGQPEGLDELMRGWHNPPSKDARYRRIRSADMKDWEAQLATALPAEAVHQHLLAVTAPGPLDWEALFDEVGLIVERVDTSFHISPTCLTRLR